MFEQIGLIDFEPGHEQPPARLLVRATDQLVGV
jgi:hypothetical protein